MHYCGIVPAQRTLQLAMLEEVRAPEPPIRLSAIFFEPGSAAQVAAELSSLGEVVVGVGVERRTSPRSARSASSSVGPRRKRSAFRLFDSVKMPFTFDVRF